MRRAALTSFRPLNIYPLGGGSVGTLVNRRILPGAHRRGTACKPHSQPVFPFLNSDYSKDPEGGQMDHGSRGQDGSQQADA